MPFDDNSLTTNCFEDSNAEELRQIMFPHINMQAEDPRIPERGSTLDQIMHLQIYFHELLLTLGSSYFKFLGWISKEKAVMNTKNNDEQYLKWVVFATSRHKNDCSSFSTYIRAAAL